MDNIEETWQDCEQEGDKERWKAEARARQEVIEAEQQRLIELDAAHGA